MAAQRSARDGRDQSGDGFGRLGQCFGRKAGQWRRARDSELRRDPQERDPERLGRQRGSAAGHAGAAAATIAAARRDDARRGLRRIARRTHCDRARGNGGGGHLLCAHIRRRRHGLRGARRVMHVTFMGSRQRRHGERHDQNGRRGDARKLSLQAHTVFISRVPGGAKQFRLMAVKPEIFESGKIQCTRSNTADVIPSHEVTSSGRRQPSPLLLGADNQGSQAVLVYRCPTTHRQVKSEIQTTAKVLARLGALKLSLWCPHCGDAHTVCANEATVQHTGPGDTL
jgi:hypothetical protein